MDYEVTWGFSLLYCVVLDINFLFFSRLITDFIIIYTDKKSYKSFRSLYAFYVFYFVVFVLHLYCIAEFLFRPRLSFYYFFFFLIQALVVVVFFFFFFKFRSHINVLFNNSFTFMHLIRTYQSSDVHSYTNAYIVKEGYWIAIFFFFFWFVICVCTYVLFLCSKTYLLTRKTMMLMFIYSFLWYEIKTETN